MLSHVPQVWSISAGLGRARLAFLGARRGRKPVFPQGRASIPGTNDFGLNVLLVQKEVDQCDHLKVSYFSCEVSADASNVGNIMVGYHRTACSWVESLTLEQN